MIFLLSGGVLGLPPVRFLYLLSVSIAWEDLSHEFAVFFYGVNKGLVWERCDLWILWKSGVTAVASLRNFRQLVWVVVDT